MKKGTFTKCGVLVFLCSLLMGTFLVGCGFNIGGWGKAKFKRTQNASAPLAPGLNVSVETNYGSITVNGADVSDCNVIAKITAQAPTQQEAQQIAEQVKIELEQVGDILNIKAKKPDLKNNRSICISYEITVPMRTSVDCESSYGSLKIANIIGDVRAETSYGSVNCDNLQGSAQLETSYGKINCRGINAPKISARSSYGSINIEYSASAAPQTEADVVNIVRRYRLCGTAWL